jgi:hypothetical protein
MTWSGNDYNILENGTVSKPLLGDKEKVSVIMQIVFLI